MLKNKMKLLWTQHHQEFPKTSVINSHSRRHMNKPCATDRSPRKSTYKAGSQFIRNMKMKFLSQISFHKNQVWGQYQQRNVQSHCCANQRMPQSPEQNQYQAAVQNTSVKPKATAKYFSKIKVEAEAIKNSWNHRKKSESIKCSSMKSNGRKHF